MAATSGFAQENLLGEGGFWYVHKGVLPNGKAVAVKSLKSGSGLGNKELQTEVETISRVRHRNLVSLVGYCIAGEIKMLVYDFIPNSKLEFHLHGIVLTHFSFYICILNWSSLSNYFFKILILYCFLNIFFMILFKFGRSNGIEVQNED